MEEELDSGSGLVKHLDFADVTFTLPTISLPVTAASKNVDDQDVPAKNSVFTLKDVGENNAIEELRREARNIRENLAELHGVSIFPQSFKEQIMEAGVQDGSVKELKKLFSFLKSEYLELAAKEGLLTLVTEFKEDKKECDSWLSDDVPEIQRLRGQLMTLKRSNADTIEEIETMINSVAFDMDSFEKNLSSATNCLETCDLEVERLAKGESNPNDNARSLALICPLETPQDLEETIRLLEEQLRQNERDYEDTEAAMKQRIEQYNLEMEELQEQARQLDKEEESLRMIVDVSSRCLKSQTLLESINDVAVLSVGDDFIELQLTTDTPTMDGPDETTSRPEVKPILKHKLYIKVNATSMEIETAELIPGEVPIDDLVYAARQTRSNLIESIDKSFESVKEGENAEFGHQFAFLVRTVHHRISIFALKAASLSSASNDPRYCVEYLPDSSVITVTVPGKLRALVEVPQGWPMQGFSLRLRSLHSLKEESSATLDFLQEVLELANNMPEYTRHDILSFVQGVERIVTERDSHTRLLSL